MRFRPQAASARPCPLPWLTSPASLCTAWPCPTFLAAENLTSCSRFTASTEMPSSRGSARCSAAPPTPSKLVLLPQERTSWWTLRLSLVSSTVNDPVPMWCDLVLYPDVDPPPSPFVTSRARTNTPVQHEYVNIFITKQLCYWWLFNHRKCCINKFILLMVSCDDFLKIPLELISYCSDIGLSNVGGAEVFIMTEYQK